VECHHQSGQSAFQKIGQMIKSSVLDLLYQMTLKRWVVSIGASVTGAAASAGGAGNGAGGLRPFKPGRRLADGLWRQHGFSGRQGGQLAGEQHVRAAEQVWLHPDGKRQRDRRRCQDGGRRPGIPEFGHGHQPGQVGPRHRIGSGHVFGGPIGGAIGSTVGKWVDNLFGGETRSGASYGVDARGTISRTEGPSGGEIASDQVRQSITTTFDTINADAGPAGQLGPDRAVLRRAGVQQERQSVCSGGRHPGQRRHLGETGRNSVQYVGDMDNQQAVAAFLTDLKRSALQAYKVAAGIPSRSRTRWARWTLRR
jgi:hypothetical protein